MGIFMNDLQDFPFQTSDLRLLTLLGEELSVKKVAQRLGRDETTVTRQLNQLAQKYPVLQKNNGMWLLTPFGLEVAKFGRKMMDEQRMLVSLPKVIRIGTTKEFSEWVLAPLLSKILQTSFQIQVLTELGSYETALMDGRVDFVLSCGKPVDPTIKFKKLKSFPMTCVSNMRVKVKDLDSLPAVEHTGLTIRSLVPEMNPEIVAQFDHISGVRGAVRAGLGWTVLPQYSVQRDIELGDLFDLKIDGLDIIREEFSLWYMRDYSNLEKVARHIIRTIE